MGKKEKSAVAEKPEAKKVEKVVEKKAEKKVAEKSEKKEKGVEGLTSETKETGTISFQKGSGSADILALITKFGFDRKKVLDRAAVLKEKGKSFVDCDPAKKYNKVAGIIKKLQAAGYKIPVNEEK
jgi:hypothetical protein